MGDADLLERILDGVEDPTNLSLQLLKDITDNFSPDRKIGHGGFGEVFKGVLGGERIVAVKRIHINVHTFDDKLFRREVGSLWNTNHRNVVRILGVCSEESHKPMEKDGSGKLIWPSVLERLLCFEYISNGSLDKHITDELRGLEWETRYEIIIGICKGLGYLHDQMNIIHMDLKPANILLHHQDEKYMVPKITDFGLSRPNEESHTMGKHYGTPGYMAPEYTEHGETRRECDIYSLGAIIIELVTGRKDVPNEHNVLRRWRHRWKEPPAQLQYQQVTRCIDIARRCRKQDPKERPSISEIISFLDESASTHSKIIPCLDVDDMLQIHPLELRLPSEPKKEISHTVELTNDTLNCIAFNIQPPSAKPGKGIVQPGSTCFVTITVQTRDVHEHDHADKLTVQSMKWIEDVEQEDITECMFRAEVVDEVDLMIVHEPRKPLKNIKRRKDTNMPVEEIPEEKKRRTGESSFENGKIKIGSNENAEEASKDINSSTRGQYTKKLDRYNFHPPENFSQNQATNMTYLLRDSDRAVDVTRGAMGSLLHKLGVLHKEFNLDMSVKKDDLVLIQHVLRKLSNVQQDKLDDLVMHWSYDVRELSYALEDFVDGFLVHSEPNSDGSSSRDLTHEMCFLLEKGKHQQPIIDLIEHHISKQVEDAAKKCEDYNVDNIVPNASAKAAIDDIRILSMYEDTEKLVGIEMRRDELIRLFEDGGDISKKYLKIVCIVGSGGLGKTTLAKAAYDQLKVHYNLKAFVSVGQNPDVKEVLKNIIGKFEAGFKGENFMELFEKLRELLKDKRYCIVIDDIWDLTIWNSIRSAFPKTKPGSVMITTTRIHHVARACCNYESKYVYNMRILDEEESRKLFFGRAFCLENACQITEKKEGISIDILKKCRGMPLAINSIASLLAGEPDSTWENVRKSLGALTKGNTERDTPIDIMREILDLSYMRLPDHLKTCLLHVCMYPEDRTINKSDLLKQWVAEGFVTTNGLLDAEEVAENYFVGLINMCMIQPDKVDHCTNEVLSCRVHDIILDIMRTKSSEANFTHVIDGLKDVAGPRGEIRRVSVQENDKDDCKILESIKGSLSHARSVLLYRRVLLPDFLKYKYVRVLHLQDYGYSEDPVDLTCISSLFLLRYLKIACCTCPHSELKLPHRIGQLQQLETIDIKGVELKNYPSDFVTLPRLAHLSYNFFNGIMLPNKIERLKSLHTLVGVCLLESSVETIRSLGELANLRNLDMCFRTDNVSYDVPMEDTKLRLSALQSSISKLSTSLRILTLHIDIRTTSEDYFYLSNWTIFSQVSHIRKLDLSKCCFERCPKCIQQLHNLYSFSISVREVADGLSIVGGLPSLLYLYLKIETHEKDKEESVIFSGFQALKHMCFYCQKATITFEQRALPKLEKLDILFRFNLTHKFLPFGIEHLPAPTLKKIILRVTSDCIENGKWKVKGSENWEEHVREIYLETDHYQDKLEVHYRKCSTLLKKAFKVHHPSADIITPIQYGNEFYESDSDGVDDEEDNQEAGFYNEEHDEDAYDDEDFRPEDYGFFRGEECESGNEGEAEEAAYEDNGSQTSSEVHANTRQSVELIEAHEDSCRMGIETDALSVGAEVWQSGNDVVLESLQPPSTTLLAPSSPSSLDLTLALTPPMRCIAPVQQSRHSQDLAVSETVQLRFPNWLAPLPSFLHLTLGPSSSPDRAPPGGLVDLSQSANRLNDEEFPKLNEDDDETSINCSRQFIQLVEEAQQDCGEMSISTDAAPLVDTSLHLAV